jgi:hypothetical protein
MNEGSGLRTNALGNKPQPARHPGNKHFVLDQDSALHAHASDDSRRQPTYINPWEMKTEVYKLHLRLGPSFTFPGYLGYFPRQTPDLSHKLSIPPKPETETGKSEPTDNTKSGQLIRTSLSISGIIGFIDRIL